MTMTTGGATALAVGELERSIVAMMIAGCTDRAIARHHHLGVRTLQRIVATLMAGAGAGNRAALGAIAVHHGWIDVATLFERRAGDGP